MEGGSSVYSPGCRFVGVGEKITDMVLDWASGRRFEIFLIRGFFICVPNRTLSLVSSTSILAIPLFAFRSW